MKNLTLQTFLHCIFALLFLSVKAQDFQHYQPILCKGQLPKEITQISSSKYKAEIVQEVGENNTKEQDAKAEFLLYQRYFTDNLLKSGKVIVNPELTDYLNEILDILLKDEPEVRAKIHLYILRSPAVNALTMNDGTILICWGLLAQLDNEAQLAYILSHEITHFKERHVLSQFEHAEKMKKKDVAKIQQDEEKDEKAVSQYSYSRDLESEADSLGLIRFLKTGYSLEAPAQTFEKLKYAYLPFANIPFTKNALHLEAVDLPKSYWLDSINPIKGINEEEESSSSSHPSLLKRKSAIQRATNGKNLTGENFLVSAEKFFRLQNISRFELPQIYLHFQFYEEALYNAYNLLQEDPNNYYLQTCIAKALSGLSMLGETNRVANIEKVEGEIQQVVHLFSKMKAAELSAVALNYVWKLHKKYPAEPEIKYILQDIFQELVDRRFENAKDLELKANDSLAWAKGLLQEELKEADFIAYFDSCAKIKSENQKLTDINITKMMRKQLKKGARLGLDKVVVVNPRYFFQNINKDNELDFFAIEKGNLDLQDNIREMPKPKGLEVDLISLADLKPEDAERMNEITLLTEWASEQIRMPRLCAGTQQVRVEEIAKKYNTDYFVWITVKEVKEVNFFYLYAKAVVAVITTPLLPWTIPPVINSFSKNYTTAMFSVVYDVKARRFAPLKYKVMNKKANKMLLNQHIYDIFAQLKAKNKSKSQHLNRK